MKKRIILSMIMLLLVGTITGCDNVGNGQTTSNSQNNAVSEEKEVNASKEQDKVEVPEDWKAYALSLNGELVSFPMTVNDLMAKGWVPSEYLDLAEEVDSKEISNAQTYFAKNELSICFMIFNPNEETKKLSDCVVVGLSLGKKSKYDEHAILLPNNVNYQDITLENVTSFYGEPGEDMPGMGVEVDEMVRYWEEGPNGLNCDAFTRKGQFSFTFRDDGVEIADFTYLHMVPME